MIERIFRLMIFSILMSAPQGHSAELCDIYKTPGDCLRQPENVLDGLGFVRSRIHQLSKDNDLTVLETPASRNPLGLVVYVYIKSNKICGIRYSQSTDIWLFAFEGVGKTGAAGKSVGVLRKCKFSHKQKLSPPTCTILPFLALIFPVFASSTHSVLLPLGSTFLQGALS